MDGVRMRDPRAAVDETGAPPHWETVVRGEHVRIKHFTSRVYRPDDLDLTVRAGELLVITGPTGCGKSSLALSLDGLIPHVVEADLEGTVTVLGADVTSTRVADLARDVGMVLQDPDTQIVTTQLLDEVCFGLENLQVPADQVEPRALEALTVVGLDARANDRPHDLSGGQRQRLVLACALAMQPKLLVLDEPTSHIDPRSAAELLSLLPRLRDEGMTIVIVEHNLDHIIDHADRLLVLDQFGRALAEGDPLATINEHWGQLCAVGVRLPTAFQVRQALAGSEAASPQQPREVEVALDHTVPDTDIDTAARQYPPAATEADPEEVIVRAEHLRIVRGRRLVVPDLSMSLRRGEFTALIGPNGAGKTTVGLALAGLIRSRGTLQVAGRDPRKLSMRSLSDLVGYVFQNPEHQFVTHTVVDEIAHGLRLRKHPESDVMERVETLLERLGLEGVRERHPFMLSGGQKRRLSVATALVTRPQLLILDEPSYGLDLGATESLMALLAGVAREGTSVVTITHDLSLAADTADRVAVLQNGSIALDGPAGAVLVDDAALERCGLAPLPVRQCLRDLNLDDPRLATVWRLDQLRELSW